MKKILLSLFLLVCAYSGYGQAYIAMPADSGAIWRYRINDVDFTTQIFDDIIYINGRDTVASAHSYHMLMSRVSRQTGPVGFDPPIVPVEATAADSYYGAIRETGKKVYSLTASGEKLLFDFNAAVGDSIPAYESKAMVTAIDSVELDGVFHRQYHTTDTGYDIIEGVGSSRGLIPDLNDGGGSTVFICFTNGAVHYSPDTTIPCTYIYPIGYSSAVPGMYGNIEQADLYPVPVSETLEISVPGHAIIQAVIINSMGQSVWSGPVSDRAAIPVGQWPKGIYLVRMTSGDGRAATVRRIVIN